jgi:hypothetical protein
VEGERSLLKPNKRLGQTFKNDGKETNESQKLILHTFEKTTINFVVDGT